MENHERMNYFD